MKDYSLLKINKKDLFKIAGYNENYSVYRSFIETQKKHPDEINDKINNHRSLSQQSCD
jgi:phage terminase small subunit